MKRNLFGILAMGLIVLSSCKKSAQTEGSLASVNIANTVVNGKVARVNTYLRDSINVNSYKLITIASLPSTELNIYPSGNPSVSYFKRNVDIEPGALYSLFLMGSATSPEGVFVKNNIPAFGTDSVVNIRVVNTSYTSGPIDVNLLSEPTVKQFSAIAYRDVSSFKAIPFKTKRITGDNVFQCRNASGTLLASYTLPLTGTISVDKARFKNITLIFKGISGGVGANAPGVFVMPHYQ